MSEYGSYTDSDMDGIPTVPDSELDTGQQGVPATADVCCDPVDGPAVLANFDTDGDGVVDQSAIDTTGDGVADTWNIDTNRDGIADQVALDTTGEGVADTWNIDANQDGVAESTQLDRNGDAVPDATDVWAESTPANDPYAPAPDTPLPSDPGEINSGDETLDSILERAERTTDPAEKQRLLDFAENYSRTMADMNRVWTL